MADLGETGLIWANWTILVIGYRQTKTLTESGFVIEYDGGPSRARTSDLMLIKHAL